MDLCRPANENSKYIFNNNTFDKEDIDPETEKRFNEKIRPVIEEAFQAELSDHKRALESLQAKLQNPESNIEPQEWDEVAKGLNWIITDNLSRQETNNPNWNGVLDYNHLSDIELNGYFSYEESKTKMKEASIITLIYKTSSIEDILDLLTERYQEFLKDYENNKTKFTAEERQTITKLGRGLENKSRDDWLSDFHPFAKTLDYLIKKGKGISVCREEDCKKWVLDEVTALYQELTKSTSNEGQKQRLTWPIESLSVCIQCQYSKCTASENI